MDPRLSEEDRNKISKPCSTPAASNEILTKEMCPKDATEQKKMALYPYKSVLGQLLYIAVTLKKGNIIIIHPFLTNPISNLSLSNFSEPYIYIQIWNFSIGGAMFGE